MASFDHNVKGMIASYKISMLIVKRGLPFTVEESLLVPAVEVIPIHPYSKLFH